MNGPDLWRLWQPLQPSWPLLLLGATIALLILTLLAFLVLAFLLRRHNVRKAEQWDRYDRDWGELVERAESGAATDEEVAAAVGAGEKLQFIDFLYKQALRTTDARRRRLLSGLALPYLPQLVSRTRGTDPERRARAVKTLAELGGEAYTRMVIDALDDPAPLVAMSAARALAGQATPDAVREIVARVDRFADWNSRFLRATLAQLGPRAIPGLRRSASTSDLAPGVRAVCLEVLGDLEDPEAGTLAGELLAVEEHVDLRAASLRVIRRTGDRGSLALVQALCAHEDPIIRAQAIGTLASIAGETDYALLEGALADPSPWVALHAARGLKQRGRVEVLERACAGDAMEEANSVVAFQVLREES